MKVVDFVTACTRPAVTVIMAGVIAQVITQQIPIPEYQWAILVLWIGWWFKDRSALHSKEKTKNGEGQTKELT